MGTPLMWIEHETFRSSVWRSPMCTHYCRVWMFISLLYMNHICEHVTYETPCFHSNIIQFTFWSMYVLFNGQIDVLSYLRLWCTWVTFRSSVISYSQGSDRSDWERSSSWNLQGQRVAEAGKNRPRHDSDALVGASVFHIAIMHDNLRTMEDVVGNFWKEGRHNKDVSDPVPLQLADERIWFGSGTP